jgi:type II secretory pathway pseudopilin PulG
MVGFDHFPVQPFMIPLTVYRDRTDGFPSSIRGVSLVELGVVLMVMSLLAVGVMREQFARLEQQKAMLQGEAILTISRGVERFVRAHADILLASANPVVTGYASAKSPAVGELVSAGFLPTGLTNQNFYGGGYAISLSRLPDSCTACTGIQALVYIDKPMLDRRGEVSVVLGAVAMSAIGTAGGFSLPDTPQEFTGINRAWSALNPDRLSGMLATRNQWDFQAGSGERILTVQAMCGILWWRTITMVG